MSNPRPSTDLVLIVDDHAATRSFVRDLLAPLGWESLEAETGVAAVDAYVRRQPDWVVMDIEMPQMDGLTATRHICTRDPRARVVVISQYQDAFFGAAARDAGACAFLHKGELLALPELLASPPAAL